MPELPDQFIDSWVLYLSDDEEGMWVAHSLNTDQVGMGTCALDAYVALYKAMQSLLEAASKDPRINLFRRAPDAICERVRHARPVPKEIVEIAQMRLRGRHPRRRVSAPYGGRCRNLSAQVELVAP